MKRQEMHNRDQPKAARGPSSQRTFLEDSPLRRVSMPPGVAQDRLQRCLDAIEAPWSRREENELRLAWNRDFGGALERSRFLVEEVERIRVEPFQSPEPLPPIDRGEIQLICWMAIRGGG